MSWLSHYFHSSLSLSFSVLSLLLYFLSLSFLLQLYQVFCSSCTSAKIREHAKSECFSFSVFFFSFWAARLHRCFSLLSSLLREVIVCDFMSLMTFPSLDSSCYSHVDGYLPFTSRSYLNSRSPLCPPHQCASVHDTTSCLSPCCNV